MKPMQRLFLGKTPDFIGGGGGGSTVFDFDFVFFIKCRQ